MRKSIKVSLVLFALALATGGVNNAQSAEMMYNSFNAAGVDNGPTVDTTFTLTKPTAISSIINYHWNYGAGKDPNAAIGWIGIEQVVNGAANVQLGRWPAFGKVGAYGMTNVFWVANPNLLLGPGTYKIVDSDPATWSFAGYSYAPVGTEPYGDGVNWELYKGFTQIFAAASATATSPAAGATGVAVKQPLTITFSENVAQGPAWNNITATYVNYAGTAPVTVTVPLTKSLKGKVLTLTPRTAFRAHALVTVTLPAGSVVDAGVAVPGFGSLPSAPSAAYQYTFSTAP